MKNKLMLLILTTLLMGSSAAAQEKIPAFPDAEGGGMWTTGARGGETMEVYHVTNLNDSGPGSFRDAVSQSNRFIVFDVGGNINIKSLLEIRADNLTILGQTAPGDGISIDGDGVYLRGSNIIMRYLRIRCGEGSTNDALWATKCENIIVDHCSISWGMDECASFTNLTNATLQWSIVSEALNKSSHPGGQHGYGGIWGGMNFTGHHNLLASNNCRNPRIGTGATVRFDNPDTDGVVNVRNNVMYNWIYNVAYGGENGIRANFVGNYYKPGPATTDKNTIYMLSPTSETSTSLPANGGTTGAGAGKVGWSTTLHVDGNYMEGNDAVSNDNWLGVKQGPGVTMWTKCEEVSDGIEVDGVFKPNNQYLDTHPVITQDAKSAYDEVLKYAGASLKRDPIDTRVVNDVINKTAPTGTNSGYGMVDFISDVGGFVVLDGGVKEADSDNDGIADSWEIANGLDAMVHDSLTIAEDGYTYLEKYAEDLTVHEGKVRADKTALREMIYRAFAADADRFDVAEWDRLQNVLEEAVETVSVVYAEQEDIDAILTRLTELLMGSPAAAQDKIPAFPDAEGGGMWATGARGGETMEVYHVTNLNNSGPGSFRDAVSKGNRFVVFDVGGNINLTKRLYISADNITILGQTAPGDGISIDGDGIYINGSNVIMRYLRVRPGEGVAGENNDSRDAFTALGGENIIIDHCSFSWSVDECLSIYAVKNATVQWCMISEPLNYATHSKGAHGYGGIWGGINMTGHHNLFATNTARNPLVSSGDGHATFENAPDTDGMLNFRNNVIYNWKNETGGGARNGMRVNVIGNYYKPGPVTKKSAASWFFRLNGTTPESTSLVENGGTTGGGVGKLGWSTTLFVDRNYMEGADNVNADNWAGVIEGSDMGDYEGAWVKCRDISDGIYVNGVLKPNNQYLDTHPVITQSAAGAYSEVVKYAGASVKRDAIDTRVINDVINGTAPTGSKSGYGLVDSPEDVGGFITLPGGAKEKDSDNDGIVDSWETTHGLNENVFDSLTIAEDGYTMLEKYAEGLAVHEGETKADKTALRKTIYQAQRMDKYGYTKASWNNLQSELNEAEETAAVVYALQVDVDNACENLKNALSKLETDSKYDLRVAIDEANLINSSMYTMDSYSMLMRAIDMAEAVYADAEAVQADVDSSILNLQTAIDALVIDYRYNLNQTIAKVDVLNQVNYTTETMAAIIAEYDNAKALLKNPMATNEDFRLQYERLKAAYDARVTDNDIASKVTGDFEKLLSYGMKSGTYGQYRLALETATGEIAENVGDNPTKALILRDNIGSRTSLSYTFPEKQHGVLYYEGDFYFEEEPKTQNLLLRLTDADAETAAYFVLMVKRPGLQLQYFNEIINFPEPVLGEKKWYKVGVFFDTVSKKYSIWIDGDKAAEGAFADTSAQIGIDSYMVATPGSESQTMAVDNLRTEIIDGPMILNHELTENQVTCDIVNYNQEELKLVIASYEDGRLIDVDVADIPVQMYVEDITASISSGDEVKVFLWKGDMEPVMIPVIK